METKEDVWVHWHLINQLAAPGAKCLEDFVLSVHSGFNSWSAWLFLSPPRQKLCHCHCLCWGQTAVPHRVQDCDLQPLQIRSSLSATSLKSSTVQSLFHMHQCIRGNGSSLALVLIYHRRMRLISLPLTTLKRKEKTQSNQTNSFSVSNTESELWNSCFRYKQWSRHKTTQRNKFYFLPTDGNQQMLKSATVTDKHADIHSYVLITSSLGKLWRKEKLNHFRGFSCYLSGKSRWGIKEKMLQAHKKQH